MYVKLIVVHNQFTITIFPLFIEMSHNERFNDSAHFSALNFCCNRLVSIENYSIYRRSFICFAILKQRFLLMLNVKFFLMSLKISPLYACASFSTFSL